MRKNQRFHNLHEVKRTISQIYLISANFFISSFESRVLSLELLLDFLFELWAIMTTLHSPGKPQNDKLGIRNHELSAGNPKR